MKLKNRELWKKNIGYAVTKLTVDAVQKLGHAFAIGATIPEACDYADIAPRTYYYWVSKNDELLQYFERMRQKLPLVAKDNIATEIRGNKEKGIKGDIGLSRWLIERQQPEQYGETLNLKHSGEIGKTTDEDKEAIDKLHETLKQNMFRRSRERAKAEGEIQ